jgi:glucose/arabinose dehydrogenase
MHNHAFKKSKLLSVITLTTLLSACAGTGSSEFSKPPSNSDSGKAGGIANDTARMKKRRIDAADIQVPPGYKVEAVATDLSYPSDITFGDNGEIYISETGPNTYGVNPLKAPPARILQLMPDGSTKVIYDNNVPADAIKQASSSTQMPEGLIGPIEGITWNKGKLYVAHRTRYSTLDPKTGEFRTFINGLPAWGIFHNTKIIFGPDQKMYFGISSQGNAGVVDKAMMKVIVPYNKYDKHEVPCDDMTLTGKNFPVKIPEKADDKDPFGEADEGKEFKVTGAFVPLGTATKPGQKVKGEFICNGALYRANPDGSNIERLATGIRNAFGYNFSPDGRFIFTNNSGNAIPPRRIHNDWETIYELVPGAWYGWPDYYSGVPVTDPRFADAEDSKKPPQPHVFILDESTRKRLLKGRDKPVQPLVRLKPHVAAQGFTFGKKSFGIPEGEILLAEFGTVQKFLAQEAPGHRISRVNLKTGQATDFMVNKSGKPASATGGGGLERPLRAHFGPDGALYVVDWGEFNVHPPMKNAHPTTGVIWKVTRTGG